MSNKKKKRPVRNHNNPTINELRLKELLRGVTAERDLLNNEASIVLEEFDNKFKAMEKRIVNLEEKINV